jgi:hypothetical protein
MILKYLWAALICTLVIFILCVIPGQDLPKVGIINSDKAVHSVMFGALTYLYAILLNKQTTYQFLNRHYLVFAFLFSTLYGGFMEILQANLDINRAGDWFDFLFDGIGALATIVVLNLKKDWLLR